MNQFEAKTFNRWHVTLQLSLLQGDHRGLWLRWWSKKMEMNWSPLLLCGSELPWRVTEPQ